MPHKPYRIEKRQRCPINFTELKSVKVCPINFTELKSVTVCSTTHAKIKDLSHKYAQNSILKRTTPLTINLKSVRFSLVGRAPSKLRFRIHWPTGRKLLEKTFAPRSNIEGGRSMQAPSRQATFFLINCDWGWPTQITCQAP